MVHAGNSVTKEHSLCVKIKADKYGNSGALSNLSNAEIHSEAKRSVTEFSPRTTIVPRKTVCNLNISFLRMVLSGGARGLGNCSCVDLLSGILVGISRPRRRKFYNVNMISLMLEHIQMIGAVINGREKSFSLSQAFQ